MINHASILLTVVVAIVAGATGKSAKIEISEREAVIPDVDYYSCSGRHDTHELHPWDCTRFIHCDNGRAHDKSCAKCHVHPDSCPEGWLHFNPAVNPDGCEWADVAGCHVSGNQTHPPTTTTPRATTTKATHPTTTTHKPPTTTTEETGVSESPNTERCKLVVNCEYQAQDCECTKYFQCKDGIPEDYDCPEGLHFNNATGQCDLPESAGCNLDPKKCCKCAYLEVEGLAGTCTAAYIFQDVLPGIEEYEGMHHCEQTPKECKNGLVFNVNAGADGTCDFPNNVEACPK